ncbi:ketopantoate reductase family protein, partial [Thermoproteota archaeon]
MSAQKVGKKKAKTGDKKTKGKKIERPIMAPELKEETVILPEGKMEICVIGTEAIGCLIAAYLRKKMRKVFIVDDLDKINEIRKHGLKVEGAEGIIYLGIEAKEQLDRTVDLIIMAVKSHEIRDAIDTNRKYIDGVPILTLHNSIVVEKAISKILGENDIISSITLFSATQVKPGLIKHDTKGKWLIGRPFSANDEIVKQIVEEIAPAFEAVAVEDITAMKWTNLVSHTIDSLAILLGKSMQETFSDMDMARLAVMILKESFEVAEDSGIKLTPIPDSDLAGKLRKLVEEPLAEAARELSTKAKELG